MTDDPDATPWRAPEPLSGVAVWDAAAEIDRLRAALTQIRQIAAETHAGKGRAYTALSRIDRIAREGLE